MVVLIAAEQAFQHAVALSRYFVVLRAFVVMLPAVMCSTAAVAFNGVNWGLTACGRGVVCHGSDGKVPDSAVMTTRARSILVMDYS
jgi:hypothetical protein